MVSVTFFTWTVIILSIGNNVELTQADVDCSVVSTCLINHFMVIKDLLQESTSLSQTQQTTKNDSEAKIDKICLSFKPIIDCTGREAAIQCHFKIGKRGQVFRLYYLVVLCEITIKLRKCSQEFLAARNATTVSPCRHRSTTLTPPTTSPGYFEKSVCSQQFPDVENQTEEYRHGISTPAMSMSDDPYAAMPDASDEVNQVAGVLFKIGEKCDRLRLYVGCWLHYSKDMCGEQAADIIQRMYEIYNDLSGRQCSAESAELINYNAFEEDYIKQYGRKTTPAPCDDDLSRSSASSTVNNAAVVKMELAHDGASAMHQGGDAESMMSSRRSTKAKRTTTPIFDETYEDSDAYKDGALSRHSHHSAFALLMTIFISSIAYSAACYLV